MNAPQNQREYRGIDLTPAGFIALLLFGPAMVAVVMLFHVPIWIAVVLGVVFFPSLFCLGTRWL